MHRTVAPSPQLQTIGWLIAFGSMLAIAFATLSPEATPFESAGLCIICGPRGGVDAILNILLFIPIGIGLAIARVRGGRAIVSVITLSALVEIAQFVAIAGRDASIGDLLTNSIGGAIGFAIARYAFTWLRPTPRVALGLAVSWSVLWLAIQTVSSFALVPSLPPTRYYGQIAREFTNLAPFRGRVIDATIGSETVPDVRITDSRKIRALLGSGAEVRAVVVPAGPTPRIAPILRIADNEQTEIVLLAQRDRDLVFGVRTGAAVLRLRPPQFAMPKVFPGPGHTPTDHTGHAMRLSAHFGPDVVGLRVQRNSEVSERQLPLTSSLGWTLILPFQWYMEGSRRELILTCAWIAFFSIPLAYWASWIVPHPRPRPNTLAKSVLVVAILGVLTIGFVVAPRLFGLSAGAPADWLASLFGLIAGSAAAHATKRADNSRLGTD